MKIIVIIPTYNEAENVNRLVPLLAEEFKNIPHEMRALFVDDSSPDGTGDILEKLKANYPFVNILTRTKKTGLGAAYVDGFKHAINVMGADVVMEMDADLQHDPKDISRFVKEIEAGYDFVIGSRYLDKDGIPREWAFYRKFLSWGGNIFTRIVLGLFSQTEFSNGYRATRVKGVLDRIDLGTLMSNGFAYKFDLLYKIHKLGAKMKEIPVKFGLRDGGKSKMEQNNFMESLRVVLLIRVRESQRFLKFITVGFIGLGVDGLIFNLLRISILPSDYSSAASGFIAMITTFVLNNTWSFKDKKLKSVNEKFKAFPLYVLISYIPIVFRSWLIGVAVRMFSDTALVANAALFIGVVIGTLWNFIFYSKVVWRKKNI
ncbi:hypothetical protein A2886_01030 [candidate division WWE3 bacterium RIFCSPHIGHO2_01_FULL_42_13]|uniref:Dolichyl-phosphate beta-D-mannosyltransferase n=1 Tax=candidate division WWE3 bacterium RIFCSPHIGHO2_01_FULL_42_13 TaxID=1802617 RepID=A0A1F4UQI9_UNCKA|nr:MAG: hypothetical protein A2886_01030 [candidate division WWE3 bacterium RIFCSPHIGHO2_01_FULL_42_13]